MANVIPEPESFLNVMAQLLRAGRQIEAEGDPVVFHPSSGPLSPAQRRFLDCAEALTSLLGKAYEEAVARGDIPTGPCWVCGAEASERCDDGYDGSCHRWLCDAHLVIEAQHCDSAGWDGVDFRCQAHRNLSLDSRDWGRGRGVPPAPRWEGTGDGLLTVY